MKTDEKNEEQKKNAIHHFVWLKVEWNILMCRERGVEGAMWLLAGQEDVSALLIYET